MKTLSKALMAAGCLFLLYAILVIARLGKVTNEAGFFEAVSVFEAVKILIPAGIILLITGAMMWVRAKLKETEKK